LFIINISSNTDAGWYLEGEFLNRGVTNPNAVVKTDLGIIWANEHGLFAFSNGIQKLSEVIKEETWRNNINDDKVLVGFIPKRNQVNINFYKMAKKVICLSKMHRNIFEKNLFLENLENINCSMWSDGDLELFKNLQNVVKKHKFAIINSSNPIKKTRESIEFCDKRGIEYDLISSPNYHEFIKKLAEYRGLVFMTGHPEPTPRVAIEAKMLNCSFLSQKKLISVAHEDYFDLKGINMIDKVRQMRDDALAKILGWINEV